MGFKRSWKHCWDNAKSLSCAVSVTAQHSLDAFHCLHFSPPVQRYTHSLFSKHKLTGLETTTLKIAISEKIPSSLSWVLPCRDMCDWNFDIQANLNTLT